MADNTAIEWADSTWSPWIGCQKVSPGCDRCYAEALNKRTGGGNWGPGAPRRRTSAAYWKQPYRWNNSGKPRSVFPSLCDPFDKAVDPAWRRDFGWVIRETTNLRWLLLTKRIGNALEMLDDMLAGALPDNLSVGATFVNQAEVDRDWLKLLAVADHFGLPLFASFEPLLERIEVPEDLAEFVGWWLIGAESGHGARFMQNEWAQSLVDQAERANVLSLVKQLSSGGPKAIKDIEAFPEGLRVREFPA